MPKLYFRYGAMNSSKTANLLMLAHNYRSQGKKVFLMKPDVDTRFGSTTINSRAVKGMEADILLFQNTRDFDSVNMDGVYCILVDEAQFLSDVNVEALRKLTVNIPVICYGLRTDYRSQLFPGSKRLLELADTIEEIKTVCVMCDKKAIINAKFHTVGETKSIIRDGSSAPDLGAEEKYQPMCWGCWS
jgi:thymidine kinase